jgi:hypothetical protein
MGFEYLQKKDTLNASDGFLRTNFAGDVSGRLIGEFFFIGIVLVVLSDVPNSLGLAYRAAQLVLGVLLMTSFVLPSNRAILLLFLLAVTGQDIVGTADSFADDSYATASIWQFNFGPVRPSWLIFACVTYQLVRVGKLAAPLHVRMAMFWLASVPVITGLFYGGIASDLSQSEEIVKDLKFGFMLVASLLLFLTLLRRWPPLLPQLLAVFTGGLLARHSMDMVYFVFNMGPSLTADVSRVSLDSAKGAVVFLIFFGAMLVLMRGRYVLGGLISACATLLLAVYGTRLLWITFPIGALLLSFFMGLRRSASLAVVLLCLITGGLWAFYVINPRSAEVVLARSTSITVGREIQKFSVDVPYNVVSRVDPIRYGEGMNILHSMDERFAYLWGMGYGGYYEDGAVRFYHTLSSSFPQYSLDSGIFYSAHAYSLNTFLKHGLIGLIIISALWWVPGFRLFRVLRGGHAWRGSEGTLLQAMALCLLAFLPTAISQLYWSGKGLFINGALLAMCMVIADRESSNPHPEAQAEPKT